MGRQTLSDLLSQLRGQDAASGMVRRCEQTGLTADQRARALRLVAVAPEVADLTTDELRRAFSRPEAAELSEDQQFDAVVDLFAVLADGVATYSRKQVAERARGYLAVLEGVPETRRVLHAAGRPVAEIDATVKRHVPWLVVDWRAHTEE